MGNKQNLTVSLDTETLRAARVLAASRGTSISKLVGELVAELVDRERTYEQSMADALAKMEEGFDLGGGGMAPRGELHGR